MENTTGTIEKVISAETTPANWDEFLEIIGENISEEEIDAKTSHFSNKEELWQFFLNTL